MVRPGRVQLAAAMGPAFVVMRLVLGQDRPQMPFAEDEHPVGDLVPLENRIPALTWVFSVFRRLARIR